MTVIRIVVGAFRTSQKGLAKGLAELEIRRRIDTIQNYESVWIKKINRKKRQQ